MAEFFEVMKQWRRMCLKCDCTDEYQIYDECPLKIMIGSECSMGNMSVSDLEKVEPVVLQWAAEHPELVYPTWWEYLTRIHVIFPAMGDFQKCVDDLATTPIPADIAVKLDIPPKEAE